jgi:hypothetical protein
MNSIAVVVALPDGRGRGACVAGAVVAGFGAGGWAGAGAGVCIKVISKRATIDLEWYYRRITSGEYASPARRRGSAPSRCHKMA